MTAPAAATAATSSGAATVTADPATPGSDAAPFNLDAAWVLHPQVSIRPERFGALLYHFGTRRLSFLKSAELLAVVNALATSDSAREACLGAGLTSADLPAYRAALQSLARSQMIRERLPE